MGKESKRPSRETRKPKSADKREKAGPRYMAAEAPLAKPFAPPPAKKK
jgi:hypothetical protein